VRKGERRGAERVRVRRDWPGFLTGSGKRKTAGLPPETAGTALQTQEKGTQPGGGLHIFLGKTRLWICLGRKSGASRRAPRENSADMGHSSLAPTGAPNWRARTRRKIGLAAECWLDGVMRSHYSRLAPRNFPVICARMVLMHIHPLDLAIVVAYLLGVTALGLHFRRGSRTPATIFWEDAARHGGRWRFRLSPT